MQKVIFQICRRLALSLWQVAIVLVLSGALSAEELKKTIQDALDTGDTAKAENLLIQEIDIDRGYHYNHYILGRIYFNRMNFQKALVKFEDALDKKKRHYESLYYFGLCQLETGDVKGAEKSMKEGLKKARNLKDRFENGFGLVMMEKKDYIEADRAFRRALAIDSTNPEYHIHLGDANFYQGIPILAIGEYEKALAVDTASLEVYFHWAEACLELRDYTCAIEKLKIVLSKDSTHAPAWMRAGGIYYKAARSATTRADQVNRFKEAIGSYKRYLELAGDGPDSSNVRAYFDLAMSYFSLSGYEDAVENFEKVLSIPFEPRDVYFYYGKSLWGIRDYVGSGDNLLKHIEWLDEQDDDYKSTVHEEELYKLLGDAFYYRKPRSFLKALPWYKKSLEIDSNQKRLVYNIAVAYHNSKSYAQAIEYYQKRIELGMDSAFSNIYKNAGFCALNLANVQSDGEELDLDLEDELEDAGDFEALDANGADSDVDYYQLAVDFLIEYTNYNSGDVKVVTLIANTYLYQLADCSNGVKWFQELLELVPNNCDAKKALGFAYFGGLCNKNYTKALGMLRDAYGCTSSETGACADTELVMWIAQCYHLRGADKISADKDANEDFKNAYKWYGKVLGCEPSNSIAKKGRDDLQFEFVD